MNDDNIRQIYETEIKDKKRVARSAAARASKKKGFKGKVMFLSDMLSGKAKKDYIRPGKVVRYNMYDNVLVREEFDKLNTQERLKHLQEWKSRGLYKKVASLWGISLDGVKGMYKRIEKAVEEGKEIRPRNNPRKLKKQKDRKQQPDNITPITDPDGAAPEGVTAAVPGTAPAAQEAPAAPNKFSTVIAGKYTRERLVYKLTKLAESLEPDREYVINLVLDELDD